MQIRFPVVVEKDILGPKIKLRNKQNSGMIIYANSDLYFDQRLLKQVI